MSSVSINTESAQRMMKIKKSQLCLIILFRTKKRKKNLTDLWFIIYYWCATCYDITKTYLYNFDPLKPHFYVLKLGFTGYTLFFSFLLKDIDCGYSLEPPRRAVLTSTTIYVLSRQMKNIRVFIWKFPVFGGKLFYIFKKASFRNEDLYVQDEQPMFSSALLPVQSDQSLLSFFIYPTVSMDSVNGQRKLRSIWAFPHMP